MGSFHEQVSGTGGDLLAIAREIERLNQVGMPARVESRTPTPPTGWRWQGVVVSRAWDASFTFEEYQLIQVGGSRRRLAHPDATTREGQPIWHLPSERMRRAIERDLDRHCLHGFEARLLPAVGALHPLIRHRSNVACNAGRTILLDFIANQGGLAGVNYFAVGTGANPVFNSTDTQLASEFFRAQISGTAISGGQINLSCFFTTAQANGTYTECGVFGNGATGTANSGTLFNHASDNYTKTSLVALTNNVIIQLT